MNGEIIDAVDAVKRSANCACSSEFELNLLAVTTAENLARGRDRRDIEKINKFLSTLQAALRTYL